MKNINEFSDDGQKKSIDERLGELLAEVTKLATEGKAIEEMIRKEWGLDENH